MIMEGTSWVIRTPDQTKRLAHLLDARLQNGPLLVDIRYTVEGMRCRISE